MLIDIKKKYSEKIKIIKGIEMGIQPGKTMDKCNFEESSGWKANSNNLTLTDPHQNALYLTTIYSLYTWQHE